MSSVIKAQEKHRPCVEVRIDNWTLQKQTVNDHKYMQPLFSFVLHQFVEIFGAKLLKKEPATIYNDSQAPFPMLIINRTPISVRTNAKDLCYWCQFIYQLSHELTHYVVRQCRNKNDNEIRWFEETVCEAASLYILWQSSKNWSGCALSIVDPSYFGHLKEYLDDIYTHTSESILQKCCKATDLQRIESSCEDKEQRLGRSQERNYLYNLFCEYPDFLPVIVRYPHYAQNNLLLDLDRWRCDVDKEYVLKLQSVQPSIR